jgi:hypothetical protein
LTAEPAAAPPREVYPGVWLDLAAGHVEVTGHIIGQRFDWLELLATRGDIRAHEAILRLDADARQVHLALLLLGLEPGRPASTRMEDGRRVFISPEGPELELFFILPDPAAAPVPANTWVVHQDTGEDMPGNRWLFVGSKVVEHQGRTFFLAEENGTVVSLVNFGDELIGRPTDQSQDGGNDLWNAHPTRIPPPDTPVRLRIVPVASPETTISP